MSKEKIMTTKKTHSYHHKKTHAKIYAWFICFLAALFYTYEYFLRQTPSALRHYLTEQFHLTGVSFGTLAAFYYFAYTPMQLFVGVLLDRFGPHKVLSLAVLICILGTLCFANSHLFYLVACGRFLVGIGSAFAFVGVLKVATIWLPPNRFALISGLATALGVLGPISSDFILPILASKISPQFAIYASAAIGLVIMLLIFGFIRDKNKAKKVMQQQPIKSLKAGFTGLGKLIKRPVILLNGLIGCLLFLPLTAFAELWAEPFLKTSLHASLQAVKIGDSAIFIGSAVGGIVIGFISDSLRRRRLPITLGGILSALAFTPLLLFRHLAPWLVDVCLFAFAFFAAAENIVFAIARELSERKLAGTVLALTNMLVMIGGIVFQPLIGKLLDLGWHGEIVNKVRVYSAHDFRITLVIIPCCLLLAAILSKFLPETHAKLKHE